MADTPGTWLLIPLIGSISLFYLSITQTSILLISLVTGQYYIKRLMGLRRYPPGPIGLPVLGNLLKLALNGPDEYLLTLYREYGPIVSLQLGKILNFVVSDYETMKELSMHPEFQARPIEGILHETLQGYGLLDSEGNRWRHQRRFIVHSMRDAGMGKLHLEDKITTELVQVVDGIKRANGKAMSIDSFLEKSTCNVMFGLAFNKSFEYDDPQFIERLEKLDENMLIGGKVFFISLFPWLRSFFERDIRTLKNNVESFLSMAEDFITEHRQSLDKDNPRDLLDLYLLELDNKAEGENLDYHQTFSHKQLKYLIIDLFIAGTETSSTTIKWAVLYMIRNPDIQRKVQQELDDVIGRERAPTMADRLNTPFTAATLQEVERLAAVVPRALPRSNQREASFKGFTFPARSLLTLNVYAVHMDPKLWDRPEEFRPSRFIKDGKVSRPPYLVPFGNGKRSCAGEALAKMEIFLMFTTLMQNFYFKGEDGLIPGTKANSGFVRSPLPFKVCAEIRD